MEKRRGACVVDLGGKPPGFMGSRRSPMALQHTQGLARAIAALRSIFGPKELNQGQIMTKFVTIGAH